MEIASSFEAFPQKLISTTNPTTIYRILGGLCRDNIHCNDNVQVGLQFVSLVPSRLTGVFSCFFTTDRTSSTIFPKRRRYVALLLRSAVQFRLEIILILQDNMEKAKEKIATLVVSRVKLTEIEVQEKLLIDEQPISRLVFRTLSLRISQNAVQFYLVIPRPELESFETGLPAPLLPTSPSRAVTPRRKRSLQSIWQSCELLDN